MLAERLLELTVVVALAGSAFSKSTQTQQICFTSSVAIQQTNWTASVSISKFDPALGALQQIDITLSTTVVGSIQIESLDSSPTVASADFAANVTLTRPDMSVITVLTPLSHSQFLFAPFDGTIDFAGLSGATVMPTATLSSTATSPPPASDLVIFTGIAGNPGTILLPMSAINDTYVMGPANIAYVSTMQAGTTVQVCYTYLPGTLAGTIYCSGDGSSAACPCGNVGAPGNGCPSSVNAAGATLAGTGTASVAADSFVLRGNGMPDSAALYFQGTTQIDTAFGDGKRCAGGAVVRLGIKINSGGASQYPSGSDPLVSVKGLVSAGSVRNYQVWYRNSAMFCTASTFNLTNGLSVTWTP